MVSRQRGSTLIEALAALVLVALAGAIVAAAARTNLRATRSAAALQRLTAAAALDIARVEARGAPAGIEETIGVDPMLGPETQHRIAITRSDDDVASVDARVAVPGEPSLTLSTRMLVTP
jgi:type II secretory pathway pseudopilin PulG